MDAGNLAAPGSRNSPQVCRRYHKSLMGVAIRRGLLMTTATAWICSSAVFSSPRGIGSPQAQATRRLSLEDVKRMVQGGDSEDAIVNRIKRSGRTFDLT